MTLPPQNLPTIGSDGAVMQHAGKHARNAVLTVFEMLGGARGMYDWAQESAQNKADYYKSIFPKTIQKEVLVEDKRSIEDVLAAIDGEFTVVENPMPAVSALGGKVNLSSAGDIFGTGLVVGAIDDAEETVDD